MAKRYKLHCSKCGSQVSINVADHDKIIYDRSFREFERMLKHEVEEVCDFDEEDLRVFLATVSYVRETLREKYVGKQY